MLFKKNLLQGFLAIATFILMSKSAVYTFLMLLCLSACKPKAESDFTIPVNVLTEEQMIGVLADSYLAESATGLNVLNVPGNKFDSAYVFNVFKDHGIRKSQFDSSLTFYSRHPKTFKAIYDKVLEKMSKIQASGKVK